VFPGPHRGGGSRTGRRCRRPHLRAVGAGGGPGCGFCPATERRSGKIAGENGAKLREARSAKHDEVLNLKGRGTSPGAGALREAQAEPGRSCIELYASAHATSRQLGYGTGDAVLQRGRQRKRRAQGTSLQQLDARKACARARRMMVPCPASCSRVAGHERRILSARQHRRRQDTQHVRASTRSSQRQGGSERVRGKIGKAAGGRGPDL